MNSYPLVHQFVNESRRTIEHGRELIDEAQRIREQTRRLGVTWENS